MKRTANLSQCIVLILSHYLCFSALAGRDRSLVGVRRVARRELRRPPIIVPGPLHCAQKCDIG